MLNRVTSQLEIGILHSVVDVNLSSLDTPLLKTPLYSTENIPLAGAKFLLKSRAEVSTLAPETSRQPTC